MAYYVSNATSKQKCHPKTVATLHHLLTLLPAAWYYNV